MSNGNGTVALALGAGGGLALWYYLARKQRARSRPDDGTAATPPVPSSQPAPAPPRICAVTLDARGVAVDGARVNIADAVARCQRAVRAEIAVAKDAPASAYADLVAAFARAGIPSTRRNAGARARDEPELERFARIAQQLADRVAANPTPDGRARGRFGPSKVFIAAVRRGLRETNYGTLMRREIDDLFVRAHRARLIVLARADLVAAMDPDEVRDSEIMVPSVGASFHFITSDRGPNDNRS